MAKKKMSKKTKYTLLGIGLVAVGAGYFIAKHFKNNVSGIGALTKKQRKQLDEFFINRKYDWERLPSYDGRKKMFKGIDRDDYRQFYGDFYRKQSQRADNRYTDNWEKKTRFAQTKEILDYFAQIPYEDEFTGDGMSDWEKYQCPTSFGNYAAICPGERGNNVVIRKEDHPEAVAILIKRYKEHFGI